jgi:hypothetical protein
MNRGRRISILIAGGNRIIPFPLDLKFETMIHRVAGKNFVALLETGFSQERFSA